MRNYLVIWKPWDSDSTIDQFKVIDAFAASYGIKDARKEANFKLDEYGKKYGKGRIVVVEQTTWLTVCY